MRSRLQKNNSQLPQSGEDESPAQKYQRFQDRKKYERSIAGLYERQLPFGIDKFQRDAILALESGSNVLVAAPTGAGKTVIADFAIFMAQKQNVKAFYTTPIKALSNQKFHDLVDRYGALNVGLLTGDLSINSEANIVVMTTEVLRNMIYERSITLDALRYVVLDEVHFLGDPFRGQVWEEVIIQLPQSVKVVGLSATVSNIEDFGAWIQSVRGDTRLVISEHRPVPLEQHVILQADPQSEPRLMDLYLHEKPSYSTQQVSKNTSINPELVAYMAELDHRAKRKMKSLGKKNTYSSKKDYYQKKQKFKKDKRERGNNLQEAQRYVPKCWAVVDELHYLGLLPGIYFIFSRMGCQRAVDQCIRAGLCLTTEEEAKEIGKIADSMAVGALSSKDLAAVEYGKFKSALESGFAPHHAGMIAILREIVEKVFERGLIKVVFATETLAVGINMPARSVVVEKLTKFNGVEQVPLTPGEYTQLTGRAGRRGIDSIGHAIVVDSIGFNPFALASLSSKRVYPLHSQFLPTFNMAVSLLHLSDYQTAREDLEKSFAQWEVNESASDLEARIEQLRIGLVGYEKAFACQNGDIKEFILLRDKLTRLERGEKRKIKHTRFISNTSKKEALKALEKEIEQTRQLEKTHPCRNCPDLGAHLKWGSRWLKERKELQRLEDKYRTLTENVAHHFDLICSVLQQLGYVEGEKPHYSLTSKGNLLRCLFTEKDLLLAQCLIENVFDDVNAIELASLMSSFVYEPRRSDNVQAGRRLSRNSSSRMKKAAQNMQEIYEDLTYLVEESGLGQLERLDFGFHQAISDWAQGDDLFNILSQYEVEAGDFVRTTKRLCDVLGQLAIASEYMGQRGEELKEVADRAYDLIHRDVVAYSEIIEDVESDNDEVV